MKLLKKVLLVVMFIALCTCAHTASAAPVVSVEPAFIEVSEGDLFTVNILIELSGDEDVYGMQCKLYFDNTLLNGVDDKCEKGTFLRHDGAGTNVYVNKINNTIGMVEYGETRTDVDYGVNASGILVRITFNATGSGVCELTLDNVKLSDKNATKIPDVEVHDGTCNIEAVEQIPAPTPTETEPTMSARMPTEVETTETEDQTTTDSPSPPLPEPGQITPPLTPAPTQAQQPDEDETAEQSGFASAFAATVLLIVSYLILRKSD